MGFLGSTRGLTPALDALARESVVFEHAYAQAPITTVSHATILSGTFPPRHRVTDFGSALPAAVPYLPDLFRRAGYRTAAFVGSLVLDPQSGTVPGFDRGFDRYDGGFRVRRPGEDRYQTLERRAADVVNRASAWIAEDPARPWFAWVHLYDAHDPYDPPADLKPRFAAAPYDGEIAAVDREVARLLRAAGPSAIAAVAADHGEALGDHGEETHGVFLYDAVLHVPLVLRVPGLTAGSRVPARVRLADVAPTLLDAVRIAKPAAMQGESLIDLVRLKPDTTKNGNVGSGFSRTYTDRPVYSETDYPRHAFGWSMLASWRNDRFLLVRAPKSELYDVVADPAASRNLAAARPRVVDGMASELEAFVRRTAGEGDAGRAEKSDKPIPPDVAERLAALGYVSGSGATRSTGSTGVDPKDRVGVANDLHTAVVAVEDGNFARAVPLLTRVVEREPNIPIAQFHLGVAYARQRKTTQAIAPLSRAVELQPDALMWRYELALALYDGGDLLQAARELEIVSRRLPQFADARFSYGSVLARIDRVPDAVAELRAALALNARHFRANLLLGRVLTLQNQATAALPYLRTATTVDPASAEAHEFLADAYDKLGNAADAAKERQAAKRPR